MPPLIQHVEAADPVDCTTSPKCPAFHGRWTPCAWRPIAQLGRVSACG